MPMSTARKLLLFSQPSALQKWRAYVTSLAPVAWYKLNETTGANAANSGSGGSALDMTIAGTTTLAQTGKLSAGEAILCDGATSRLQTANNAALANLTAFEYVFLVNPASVGENTNGALFFWGNGANEPIFRFSGALTSLRAQVANTSPAIAITLTTSGLSASTWALVFCAFDNAGDRKIHIYKGASGAVSEFGYSVQPALTGTYLAPSNALTLFNASNQTTTWDGLADEVMIFNGNLTPAQRSALCTLAGV